MLVLITKGHIKETLPMKAPTAAVAAHAALITRSVI